MVKTKIIATLGPSSSSETVLRKMFAGGLDIARLNFSHATGTEHIQRIKMIRMLNKKMRRAIKIMQDLEGYRIRIGKLAHPISLKKGSRFYLTQEKIKASKKEIPFNYTGSLEKIKKGEFIYIDDGRIVLKVKNVERNKIKAEALISGLLKENKGMNFPGIKFSFEALTHKDKKDLEIAITERLDFVAQSFVRGAKDLRTLKNLLKPRHEQCRIFAKIENTEALANIDEIIDEADGVIVARGDLGISVPIYKVPIIQKKIIKKCLLKNKPVVVATQMLESMTEELNPTRAEVSDVANAILDGATHLMLSGETAVGKHPNIAVDMMNKIVKYTENHTNNEKT